MRRLLVFLIVVSLILVVPMGFTPAASASGCLDKVGTFAEVAGAGPQRIEVGGGGTQHVDYYPAPGVKSISWIIGAGQGPFVVLGGFGSIWEGNGPDCQGFDYVADATRYAQGRMPFGHSGLVIDLRPGALNVVFNGANLSQSEIDTLVNRHVAAVVSGTLSPAPGFTPSPSPTPPPPGGSCQAQSSTISMGDHTITGPASVHIWTNRPNLPSWGQAEVRTVVPQGTTVTFLHVGGTLWQFAAGCSPTDSSSLALKTLDDLRAVGLVR